LSLRHEETTCRLRFVTLNRILIDTHALAHAAMYAIIVVALVAVAVRAQNIKPQTPEAIADQIATLPGYSGALSPGFSGYLHINGSASGTTSKHMHYWLVESLGDANADNTISFWTNGAYLHDIL